MTVQAYLRQGIHLEHRISYNLRKLAELRNTVADISAPVLRRDNVQNTRTTDAPFVRALERLEAMEERISREIVLRAALMDQIARVISGLANENYQLVLIYRYVDRIPWEKLALCLGISASTAKRWHNTAISLITLPEDPITIDSALPS